MRFAENDHVIPQCPETEIVGFTRHPAK
jgi:hypothetical protein